MWWNVAALVAGALLITVFIILMVRPDSTAAPMGINGDTLGPDNETMAQYQARADATLHSESLESNNKHWALVTFNPPATSAQAAEALSDSQVRVGSVLVGSGVVSGIPNPTSGYPLERLFANEMKWTQNADDHLPEVQIPGVVVHGTLDQLRAIRIRTFSVEALPSDAVWGRIGVRNPDNAGGEGHPR